MWVEKGLEWEDRGDEAALVDKEILTPLVNLVRERKGFIPPLPG